MGLWDNAAFGTTSPAESAEKPLNLWDKLFGGAINSLATLPKRAIEGAAMYQPGSGEIPTETIAPAVEAALLPMGTGAIAGVPVKAGEAVLGAGPIRAYHGSPHDFDRFDLSKIGTGEGAQAYGHGLYFAENPNTAKAYRDQLSGKPIQLPDVDSPHFQQTMREAIANNAVQVAGRDMELAKRQLTDGINRYPTGSIARTDYEAALEMLHTNPAKYAGRMYEVNINADPAHFLDWDKPLSGGHVDAVRDAASKIKPGIYDRMMGEGKDLARWSLTQAEMPKTGEAVYGTLRRGLGGDDKAAAALREAGIPGIKYLDQGSRGAGQGSSNFVVFNDKLIDIMRKYGIALPGGAAAADVYTRSQEPAI